MAAGRGWTPIFACAAPSCVTCPFTHTCCCCPLLTTHALFLALLLFTRLTHEGPILDGFRSDSVDLGGEKAGGRQAGWVCGWLACV